MKKTNPGWGIALAILAAALYALNAPLSKLILQLQPPTLTAGFLYLGAGLGMAVVALFRKMGSKQETEQPLTKKELPFTVAMVVLDIAAPVLLMFGLQATAAANASLLNNFEIVATALIALLFFREKISGRLWLGILVVTLSCALLTFEGEDSFTFSYGSLLILAAAACWGLENNCTRKISSKNPMQIVIVKGIFSGCGSIILGLCINEKLTHVWPIFVTLAVGFVAYGLSIFFYVHAQRILGAARTGAYYAVAPFIGTALSLLFFWQVPTWTFLVALLLMAIGAWLASSDEPLFQKKSTE